MDHSINLFIHSPDKLDLVPDQLVMKYCKIA